MRATDGKPPFRLCLAKATGRPAALDTLFDDADILEAVETSAWFNHTNRIFIALGVFPDEKYFAR